MELIKVNKNKNLVFKLKDGRIGVTYNSGYVRVTTKYIPKYARYYQINKKVYNDNQNCWERIKIPNQTDRIQHLLNFETKNCNEENS